MSNSKQVIFEAKRTHNLFQKVTLAKQNELGHTKTMQKQIEANPFILKLDNIEAKGRGSIVILYFKKTKKSNFRFFKRKPKNERVL
jgi:hypothetical protein